MDFIIYLIENLSEIIQNQKKLFFIEHRQGGENPQFNSKVKLKDNSVIKSESSDISNTDTDLQRKFDDKCKYFQQEHDAKKNINQIPPLNDNSQSEPVEHYTDIVEEFLSQKYEFDTIQGTVNKDFHPNRHDADLAHNTHREDQFKGNSNLNKERLTHVCKVLSNISPQGAYDPKRVFQYEIKYEFARKDYVNRGGMSKGQRAEMSNHFASDQNEKNIMETYKYSAGTSNMDLRYKGKDTTLKYVNYMNNVIKEEGSNGSRTQIQNWPKE